MITHEDIREAMNLAIKEADKTMTQGIGGPFGAAILSKEGNIIAVASNSVLGDHDPTAHAEVNAIRKACKFMGTHDLSGCILIATGEPCSMCLSAAIWANIDRVIYNSRSFEAAQIGFRDDFIYDYIRGGCSDDSVITLEQISEDIRFPSLYGEYQEASSEIY